MSIDHANERLEILGKLFIAHGVSDRPRLKVYAEVTARVPLDLLAGAVAVLLTTGERVSLPAVGAIVERARELWRERQREQRRQWLDLHRARIAARAHELQSERFGRFLSSGEAFDISMREFESLAALPEHAS